MQKIYGMLVAIAGAAMFAACGTSNSTGPSSATSGPVGAPNPCSSSQNCPPINSAGVWIKVMPGDIGAPPAPWTMTFLDKTYTGTGNAEYGFINMTSGDFQINGEFSSSDFTVGLGRQSGGKGGAVPNSIRSLEGPVSQTGDCAVNYIAQFGMPKPIKYRAQFTMVAREGATTC